MQYMAAPHELRFRQVAWGQLRGCGRFNPHLVAGVMARNERQEFQLLGIEVKLMQRLKIFLQLLDAANPDEHRGEARPQISVMMVLFISTKHLMSGRTRLTRALLQGINQLIECITQTPILLRIAGRRL